MIILNNIYKYSTLLLISLLFACSGGVDEQPPPLEITATTADSLDGMILLEYPGPKSQIQYKIGDPDFFCDTISLFTMIHHPEEERKIVATYVQDMQLADWEKPVGHWIDAKIAYYVVGSNKNGAMGPTFVSFLNKTDAQAFAQKEGGKVYQFDEITPAMSILDGGVVKDQIM